MPEKQKNPTLAGNGAAVLENGQQLDYIDFSASNEPRVDSRVIAAQLGRQHRSVQKLLQDYREDFRQLGILRFQIAVITGPGQPERYAWLNEDQCYLLLTYSRNTRRVRALKVRLVKAFAEARRALQARAEYLPAYHALHERLHALTGGMGNERLLHLNVNRLINKTAGVEAGGRPRADARKQAMLVATQILVAEAIDGAADHRDAYMRAKVALEPLQATRQMLRGGRP